MQVDLTVRDRAGVEHDVAVRSAQPVRLGAVATQLRAVVASGQPESTATGEQTSFDGADPNDVVGSPALPAGSLLVLRDVVSRAVQTPTAPARDLDRREPAALHVIAGRGAGTVIPLGPSGVVIGRSGHCTLALADEAVSREHLLLTADARGVTAQDLASTNGTTVEGEPLAPGAHVIAPDAAIRTGDTVLSVRYGTVSSRDAESDLPVVLEFAEQEHRSRPAPVQWVAALLPAVAGGALAWLTHSPVFLLFTLLSPVMLLATALGDRLHWRRSQRRDSRELRHRAADQARVIAESLARERTDRRARFPDAAVLSSDARRGRVWTRAAKGDRRLVVRAGVADLPAATEVRRGGVTRSAGVMPAVPAVVDLESGPVQVPGSPADAAGLARWWTVQLAVRHPPHVLRLALLLADESRSAHWHWARWLPHLTSVATSHDDWTEVIAAISRPAAEPGWTVAVVDGSAPDGSAAARALHGLVDHAGDPSRSDVVIVALDSCATRRPDAATLLALRPAREEGAHTLATDVVSIAYADGVARALAACSTAVVNTSIPTSCHLLDVLGLHRPSAHAIRRRWATASFARPSTRLGLGRDGPVELDLASQGPHALVVGTTGSGKSELLRSWVLGLALSCPPADVTFVLVDFKGGAAFGAAAALPHVVATVTDLDAALTHRALRSLRAELRRREHLFVAVSAPDFDTFRSTSGAPALARLVVVVDEFAALADELPDVMHGLIATAQRGRSLGVHLVLATQRPGAVTPDIRANTPLRIALRTVEPAESHDVLGSAAAASLPPNVPGRALVADGTATTEFQTAAVDVSHGSIDETHVEVLGPWRRRPPPTSAEADRGTYASVVAAVLSAASSDPPPDRLWLPPLPDLVAWDSVRDCDAARVPFALVDRPDEQRQDVLTIDLDDPSSWLIVGAPRSGRTSALVTVVRAAAARLPPATLQIYLLDGAGDLSAAVNSLPHTATALGPDELTSAGALLHRLTRHRPSGAHVLIVADGIDDLVRPGDARAPTVDDALANVVRAGSATVLLAGSRDLLSARVTAGFEHRVLLRLPDAADYQLAGVPAREVPSSRGPGRAVILPECAESQLLLADADMATEFFVPEAAIARDIVGRDTVRMRPLPSSVRLDDLQPSPGRLRLGVAGDAADELSVDPFAGQRRWLVVGPAASGRSTTLCAMVAEAVRVGVAAIAVAPRTSPLRHACAELGVPLVDPATDAPRDPPATATLVVVDDVEALSGHDLEETLSRWSERDDGRLAFVVAGHGDELVTAFTGLGAEIRRTRSGILLRPGPLDGELFHATLPTSRESATPPGRGYLLGDSAWWNCAPGIDAPSADPARPVPIQIAHR